MAKPSRYHIEGDKVLNANNEVIFTEDANEDIRWKETADSHKKSLDYQDSYINVTNVDLRKFVKEVYNLSRPQGMGFLHFKEGDISEEIVTQILSRGNSHTPVSMDYVSGRACKMNVFKRPDGLFIRPEWYDHHIEDLKELLKRCNVEHELEAA